MTTVRVNASWQSRGPFGGYVNSMAMTANSDVIYAGTQSGVYKTIDGAAGWQKTGFADIPVRVVRVAPEGFCQTINFDNVTAPCEFLETTALSNEYSSMGVFFQGPGDNDGGAVLDQCSSFFPNNYSSPNFLAFDTRKLLNNGGIPRGPETITFLEPVSDVRINAAWSHISITMNAYDASDNLLDSDEISATTGFKPMRVSATGITKLVIGYSGAATLLLDDMIFVIPPEDSRADIVYAGTDDGIYKSTDG
jgi:hypothetical protein